MDNRIYGSLLVVLTGCAVVITGLFVRREFIIEAAPAAVSAPGPRELPEGVNVSGRGLRIGPPDAPLEVVVFFDYECPYCRELEPVLDELRSEFGGALAVEYRQFPLTQIHSNAFRWAVAAECAAEQGGFEAFHRAAWGAGPWSEATVQRVAEQSVEDMSRFDACVSEEEVASTIEADLELGREIGVSGTPAMVIGRRLVLGLAGSTTLGSLIDEELDEPSSRSEGR